MHTLKSNGSQPVNLAVIFLHCLGKLEFSEIIQTDMDRTYTLQIEFQTKGTSCATLELKNNLGST